VILNVFSVVVLNPTYVIPVILLAAVYWIFRVAQSVQTRHDLIVHAKTGLIATFVAILTTSWFALPMIETTQSYFGGLASMDPVMTLKAASDQVDLTALLRFFPMRPDADSWAYKDPMWRLSYENAPFIVLSTAIAVSTWLALLRRRPAPIALLFSAGWVVGVLLCLGVHGPTANVFWWLFNHVPYFQGFRSPTNKFLPIVIVSDSALLGMGLARVWAAIRSRWGNCVATSAISACLFAMCGLYVYPMWTGQVITGPVVIRGKPISSLVDVPPYYADVAAFLNTQGGQYQTLSLPIRSDGYVTYDWPLGYDGPDYTWLLYRHRTLSSTAGGFGDPEELLTSAARVGTNSLVRVGELFGSRYVIAQHDVSYADAATAGKELLTQAPKVSFLSDLGLSQVYSAGALSVFSTSNEDTRPPAYVTAPTGTSFVSFDQAAKALDAGNLIGDTFVIEVGNRSGVASRGLNAHSVYVQPKAVAERSYGPTEWEVHVLGSASPFAMVLNETYDPNWRAYVTPLRVHDGIVTSDYANENDAAARDRPFQHLGDLMLLHNTSVKDSLHYEVNGGVNGWLIEPSTFGSSNLLITLFYVPQLYFYLGIVVSAVTWLSVTSYCVLELRCGPLR